MVLHRRPVVFFLEWVFSPRGVFRRVVLAMPKLSGMEAFKASVAPANVLAKWEAFDGDQVSWSFDVFILARIMGKNRWDNSKENFNRISTCGIFMGEFITLEAGFIMIDDNQLEVEELDASTREAIIQQNLKVVLVYLGQNEVKLG